MTQEMEKMTPERMSKRAGIQVIVKRLNDLESELTDVYRLSPGTPDDHRHEISFDDIVQRIEFLKNLYTAEVSCYGDTEEQLELLKRIKDLEHTFNQWNASRFSHQNIEETLSVCSSCTQKLLNEEERDESDSSVSKPENSNVDSDSPDSVGDNLSDEELPKKGRTWGILCQFCGVFGSGMIFGAIFVVTVMNSSDFSENEVFFHLPPT